MIIIDKVVRESNGEVIGVEILIDSVPRFISCRQDLWPGIRTGRFPPPSDADERFIRVGLLALTCAQRSCGALY